MIPRALSVLLRKATASTVAVALASSSFGPGASALAAEVRVGVPRIERPGTAGAAGSSLALPPLAAPLTPSLSPAGLAPGLGPVAPVPTLSPAARLEVLGGHAAAAPVAAARVAPALAAAPAAAAAKPAPAAQGPLAALKAWLGRASSPEAGVPAAPSDSADSAGSSDYADAQFRRLTGEAAGPARAPAAEPVAAGASGAAPNGIRLGRRAGLTAATVVGGAGLAVASAGSRAAGLVPSEVSGQARPLLENAGPILGQVGYWFGNALAFVFPIPEIKKAYQSGKVGAPAWRAAVLVGANLALGLINATVAGMPFWGVQNIFGAVAMLAAWPAAAWGRRAAAKGGAAPTSRQAWTATAAASVVALAAAAGLYFAAAAAVPAALAAWLGATAVPQLALGIQAVTGGAYFLLFLPDLISVFRGKAPHGFTPGFSLTFLLASVGFLLWTGQMALVAEAGSPQRAQFALYTALNAAYVLVSGLSWWYARKSLKAELAASKAVAAAVAAAPAAPAPVATKPEAARPPPAAEPAPVPKPALNEGLRAAEARAHSSARARAGHVRLIRATGELRGGRARWTFAYHAPSKGQVLTYGPKGVEARKTGADPKSVPMIRMDDLAALDLDGARDALAAAEPGFAPVRVEVVPRGRGGAQILFYDAKGESRRAQAPASSDAKSVPPVGSAPESGDKPAPLLLPAPKTVPALPAPAPAAETPAPPPVEPVAAPAAEVPAAEPALPRSWRRLPAEAREAAPAALLAAKAEAQERARALHPDARLVSVAINLEDPRSHWIFVFRSDKSLREITVWSKRVGVKPLGFWASKAPTLPDTRLGAMGPLDRAYAALKAARPRYRPVRVEVDPNWNGPASYRFLDALGRQAFVGADGKAVFEAAPLRQDGKGVVPSAEGLPADARGADGKSLLALKAEAQERARRLHPDARLVGAAINLEDPRAHWIFTFRSDRARVELTVWTKRMETRRLGPRDRSAPTLWDTRLAEAGPLVDAYSTLKRANPGLKLTRAELTPAWKGGAAWRFADLRGRPHAVEASARPALPAPAPGVPEERGPPAETPAPPAETPAPQLPAPPSVPQLPAPPSVPQLPAPPPAPPQAPPAPPAERTPPPAEPPAAPAPAPEPPAAGPVKHLYEDFFGFRHVRGLRRAPGLKPLIAPKDANAVIERLSVQFGIPKARVLELGEKYRLTPNSSVAEWLAVYDRLQAANRDQFVRLDHKKYSGWKSFRELANKSYPPGWKGALLRASELHKHFLGAAVRFPYHLFDMFVFGYFRRAISYEFFHSGEDFLSLSGRPAFAEKWLEAAMSRQSFERVGLLTDWKANRVWRAARRWLITPVVEPLGTFMMRRVTLAILSAVAMGLLGAFAPVLPLSFSLTAIPVLGPAIVAVLNGLPVAVGAVPFVGEFLAPVVAAATGALIKDLVLGPLLNTLILSTLLTLPRSIRERVARLRDDAPMAPRLPAGAVAKEVLRASVSWEFWRSNLKSFFGLITIGAEIEGIMTYADQIDSAIDPAFEATLGHKVGLFHAIGAAVERPEGEGNPIPFGGAITWGNVLLYKFTNLVGLDISDTVMRTVLLGKSMTVGQAESDAALSRAPAAAVIHAASTREDAGLPFDKDLWKKPFSEVTERIKQLANMEGGLDAEIAKVERHRLELLAELGDKKARLALLESQSRPVSDAERAELERLLRELAGKSDEAYAREKLAENRDLTNPPSDADALARLEALKKKYESLLPPPPPEREGHWDDLAARDASLAAFSQRLRDYAEGRGPPPPVAPAPTLDAETRDKIALLVTEIEALRAETRGEMAQRDATAQLLQSANKIRNAALRERRDGKEMLRFHTDMAKLATVMDLALSLNEINAAQAAIKQMYDLLEAKRQKIEASRQSNQGGQAGADGMLAQLEQWRRDIEQDIADDDRSARDIAESEAKTGMTVDRVRSFQADSRAFIDMVNAEDKAGSADAATEYQRRLDLLPQIREWRLNGGNPNDPDAFSVREFREDLAKVEENIRDAEAGLTEIATMPVEYAGVLIVKVPGPDTSVVNPTPEQMRQVLAERRTHWQAERAKYQDSLASIERMLDPSNTATEIDEFGDPRPESLPRWRAQSVTERSAAEASARTHLAQLDALAAQINRVAGSNIPMLSGLNLEQLQDAIKNHGDALRAVNIPDGDSLEAHEASMNLISSGKLILYAAREIVRWSKADATVVAIDDALTNTLPPARAGLQGIVGMVDDIVADIALDEAFVNSGTGGGQAMIDRKTALLRDKILPPLRVARTMLGDTLIPFQQKSADDMAGPESDYFKLYDAKKTLITEAVELRGETIPWALATFGAEKGNTAEALAEIADWRHRLQRNIDGYDDEEGHHKGIREYQVEVANRKDPNYTGTEVLYGETQPYSLPRKITQYTAERADRATQINTQSGQINDILARIETMSKGKYDLSAFRMPVGVTSDQAGVDRVQAAVDADLFDKLVDEIKRISDLEAGGSTDLEIGGGGDGTVPSGTQPPITLADSQQIRLLSLEVIKRLVPTSLAQPESAPAAYAMARFLYSNAVVDAAQDALTDQVPVAEAFLARASSVVGAAIADIPNDEAYANSGGTSETPDQVYARKIRVFGDLNAFLLEARDFFNIKQGWNRDGFETLDSVKDYYDALHDIHEGGQEANDKEIEALDTMKKALDDTMKDLEEKRRKITAWLSQLNPREKSALSNVSEDISRIMDQTRAVLESNIKWHDLQDQLGRSKEIIRSQFAVMDEKQAELQELLAQERVQGQLTPEMVRRIEALRLGRGGWAMQDGGQNPASIVIKKSEYGAFVDALLGMVTQGSERLATQDIAAIKADLLRNPQGMAALIPNSKVLDFGDTADGFYLVYQSKFSVPHGLETSSWVTLGNVAQVFGSNVSLNGYQLASPPSDDGENAPFGDKGVGVQVETLTGKNWVNYLNIDLHRFALDIPADASIRTGAAESRVMIFNDFAMMLFGDRLYVGLAGFADGAIQDTMEKPHYYGGNLKTSLKLTEVMKLNAEQRVLFAKDPRQFVQDVNLDFTGLDPDLNRNFRIFAEGENKRYSRTQVGPSFDLNRLMNPDGGGDTFTLDLFYSKTSGTDDIEQQTGGVSVLKGFSLKRDDGSTWMRIENRLTGELGEKANTIGDRLTVSFPDQGLVVSAEGRVIGSASTYFFEASKKMGDHSAISLSYGSPYVGMNHRLSLSMNTSFTLGELWSAVAGRASENLRGGEALKDFNREMSDFFAGDEAKSSRAAQELQRVFERDVAQRLITQDVGVLSREIEELRKAGAFMDNSRVRGMVGFVSSPVSDDLAERAIGGGFTVGTHTEMTLTKTQKELIAAKAQTLYREGLRLQDRFLDLTRQWQGSVVELAEAQWALKMAAFQVQNAPSEAVRAEARVRERDAEARLHQALLRYNALSGRPPHAPTPFPELNAEDLRQLMGNLQRLVAAPDRLNQVLGALDETAMREKLGGDPFNLVDWIPWVDKLTIGMGVQFQDMMANQVLTLGGSVRLPIYDPASSHRDKAFVLEREATVHEMAQAYRERQTRARAEVEQAAVWRAAADAVEPSGPAAARALSDAIRAYRNGLIGPDRLRKAFDDWGWTMSTTLESRSRAALLSARAEVDAPYAGRSGRSDAPVRLASIGDAFAAASAGSHSLAEIAARQEAAEEMARAADNRIQKAWVSIHVGMGLTADGVGWIPSIGITGIPVTPVLGFELKPEEMRELQVTQHEKQADYYAALKDRVEAGLAVQFYQSLVGMRSAQARLAVYDGELLPRLEREAAEGRDGAARRLDEARYARERARLEFAQSRAAANLLLGRPADAPLAADIDERTALEDLSRLLAAKDPVSAQRRILEARVATARAVETMVDKNLKVEMLQLEPVSLVVRSLGRLIGSFSDDPIYNPEHAAAARIQTLTEERARDAYDGRREVQAAQLSARLAGARDSLRAISGRSDAEAMLEKSRLAAEVFSLQAGLLALGANPDAVAGGGGSVPASWAEFTRRLADAEQALAPAPAEGRLDLLESDPQRTRSAGFVRYYHAKQTLGHEPINRDFVEGWIELKLKDPSTPPEVLIALAKLRTDKADRVYRDSLVGAAARADILAARFEGDVRLLRWVDARIRERDGSRPPAELDRFRLAVLQRLAAQREGFVARMGLPAGTPLEDLVRLVPEDAAPSARLGDLSGRLIADIRERQIDAVRRTLFEGGVPASWGDEDGVMQQIRANTIAERMSYKGFTPVAAFGVFRGKAIGSGFLEAPDPRDIELGLEKVMSEVLRKELQASGRLQDLTLMLHSLMSRVEDGAKGLEARRRLVEAAETDLRVRAELSGQASAEYLAAQERLIAAWDGFSAASTELKADFITLVTELEALGEGDSGRLRPFTVPERPEARAPRADPKSQLLDFWAERYADRSFQDKADALLARMGPAVTEAQRARVSDAARLYRDALRDAKAVISPDFDAAKRLDLLSRNDAEGKRLALRAELELVLRGVGLLDPAANPVAAEFMAFMRAEADAASEAFRLDRGSRVALQRGMEEAYWRAHERTPAEAAMFERLAALKARLDGARDSLLTSYLADETGEAKRFVLKDLQLDAYLKAQSAFDAELAKVLSAAPAPSVYRSLAGLYDVMGSLDRAAGQARHGRGMAALDALIMLEESRLRAARWTRQTPARVEPIAESLQTLRETRERWLTGKDALDPLYAVTRLDGDGRRTWAVDQWLTAEEVGRMVVRAGDPDFARKAARPGAIVERDGRLFMDKPLTGTGRYEIVGGADAADAARRQADTKFRDNRAEADLHARMKDSDFVALGGAGAPARGWSFAEVFGAGGLHAQGRVFFFESRTDGKPAKALHPLDALSRRPEDVVMTAYEGDKPLRRDRFPTLQSLRASDEAARFSDLTVSPEGAAKLARAALDYEASERRRGWLEVKLNSWGFARDERGELAQLYRTKDDFEAQWKAFDHAQRDLETARRELAAAKGEREAREAEAEAAKSEADRASQEYQLAQVAARERLRAELVAGGMDPRLPSFGGELDRRVSADSAYKSAQRSYEPFAKTLLDAGNALKLAKAKEINAAKAVKDAETTLARSGTWTLHRTEDLALGLDASGRVASVAAPAARGTKALDLPVAGGGPVSRSLTGPVLAAVVDAEGRLRRVYADEAAVDEAFPQWTLRSYRAGGDVVGGDGDEALTKVRFSHYEETVDDRAVPVLLSQSFLERRLAGAQSELSRTKHWSYMPYNWGNILLEIPRGIAGTPVELLTGRDPRQHHYLGRAYMYKTEGGATEHHGFFRSVVGAIDILNLLPDPVDRYYDPSQFPSVVNIDAPLRPGEGLWDKDMRTPGGEKDVHLGRQSMERQVRHAAEDLEAARVRTLSRFTGGVETVTLETRRGREGWYQESRLTSALGPQAVRRGLEDPLVSSDPASDGRGSVVTSATPGHLFVDRVERRVTVRPGADAYARQAAVTEGYAGRVAERGAAVVTDRARLEADLAEAGRLLEGALSDRARARVELDELRERWHRLAQRIGEQTELERRIAALKAEIAELEARIAFWDRYLRLLEEAKTRPETGNPRSPWSPNPNFWVWALILSFLASVAAAFWHWLRERRAVPPRPA